MNIRSWVKRAKKLLYKPSLVLMYHRVATPEMDPWELAVSPENFDQQLQVLKKTGLVKPLPDLVNQLHAKGKIKPAIFITFDDGYADNFLEARPLLEKYELPATFFISNKLIGKSEMFWWDFLAYILLQVPSLPEVLSHNHSGLEMYFNFGEACKLSDQLRHSHKSWRYWQEPPSKRAVAYLEIWRLLSPLPYQVQQQVITAIAAWAGVINYLPNNNGCMSEGQLKELASQSLFTIGAHTFTHPALASHPEEVQYQEIAQNKQYLETLTGKAVDALAYPSGSYNATTINVLKQQNFKAAFTTQQHLVEKDTDFYKIGRYHVYNCGATTFKQLLRY